MVLPGFGHTTDFWTRQRRAATRLITTFLATGRVDASGYHRNVIDFTPSPGLPAIARLVAGTLVGLPLVAGLALAGIGLRVRRRGRLGRPAGVLVRAVVAPVLGLAGWVLAALAVQATSAPVPVDDGTLVVAAVALPVALAVMAGWSDRRLGRRTRRTALAASVAAALVGAWLGAAAALGVAAVLTAAAGATAAANLALVGLDAVGGTVPQAAQVRSRPVRLAR